MKSGSLRRLAAQARTDSEGSALVEFGLICPLLLTIYFGVVVTTPGFDLDRKVTIAARTAADLTARAATMSCPDLNATLTTAAAMLQPSDPTGTTLAVANVAVTNISTTSTPNLQAKVQWSQARSVTNSAGAQAVTAVPAGWTVNSIVAPIPAGFAVDGTTFVMANVAKNYVPPLVTRLVGSVRLTHSLNWPARTPTATVWTGATLC